MSTKKHNLLMVSTLLLVATYLVGCGTKGPSYKFSEDQKVAQASGGTILLFLDDYNAAHKKATESKKNMLIAFEGTDSKFEPTKEAAEQLKDYVLLKLPVDYKFLSEKTNKQELLIEENAFSELKKSPGVVILNYKETGDDYRFVIAAEEMKKANTTEGIKNLSTQVEVRFPILNQFERRIVELTNQNRALYRLLPLRPANFLMNGCRRHAIWMFTNRIMQHDPGPVNENISMRSTADEVVNGWMNSKLHRANILNPSYRYIGVGNSGTYWCQRFSG